MGENFGATVEGQAAGFQELVVEVLNVKRVRT